MTERATLNRRLLLTAGAAAAASPMLFRNFVQAADRSIYMMESLSSRLGGLI